MTTEEIESVKLKIRNAFANITFEKSDHSYTYDGYLLESSSKYRQQFEESFESYFSAESKYKSNLKKNPFTKKTAEYYRERWDLISLEAINLGKRVHLFSETYPDFDEPSCVKEKGVVEFFDNLPSNYVLIFQELVMVDKEFYKAGTADLIFLNTDTGNLIIGDWKTNGKSIFENYKSKKLKGSFKNYASTSYNKYSMQLSHYQYMLEKETGLKVEAKWLIWLSNSSKKKESKDYKYQKVNAVFKGKYFRAYNCKNFAAKLAKQLDSVRADILMNLKKKPTFSGEISMDDLESLELELPKLQGLPNLAPADFDDKNKNKKPAKKFTINKPKKANSYDFD